MGIKNTGLLGAAGTVIGSAILGATIAPIAPVIGMLAGAIIGGIVTEVSDKGGAKDPCE